MTRKKKVITAIIVIAFVVLLAFQAYVIIESTKQRKEIVSSLLDSTDAVIEDNINSEAEELAAKIGVYGEASEMRTYSDRKAFLNNLEQHDEEGHAYWLIDHDGVATDRTGNEVYTLQNPSVLQGEADFIIQFVDTGAGSANTKVMLAVPMEENRQYHVAQISSVEQFFTSILAGQPIDRAHFVLFNEWAEPIAEMMTAEMSEMTEEEKSGLESGAASYASKNVSSYVRQQGVTSHYNVYMELEQPKGWFYGAHIDAASKTPLFTLLILQAVGAIVFGVIVLLMLALYEKSVRESSAQAGRHDALTGLYNNVSMQEIVENALKREKVTPCCFAYLDIASFHSFNSMFGYDTGDRLLVILAQVLQNSFDYAFRTNSDIFAFFSKGELIDTRQLSRDLKNEISVKMGGQFAKSVSFKYGIYPIRDRNIAYREINEGAQFALRDAKRLAKRSAVVYDEKLKKKADTQKKIEVNMIHALSKGEFKVYIQPKYDIKKKTCCGGEALIRWESEEMGFVFPDQFISLFEVNGFIAELDFFVLNSVLSMLQYQLDVEKTALPISVNQSKVTIALPNYLERLKETLKRYSVPPKYVQMEVTESSFENDTLSVGEIMKSVQEMGFTIAIDDFGTGYSSLNSLRQLPVDVLKIDKEFLKESDTSASSRKIIESIIDMSRALGIETVCEGVETRLQFEFLESIDCDVIQGYFYARPMPAQAFEDQYIH
ncbi:MAG: putative bifunctional diguanylate cyclase/phosphodiesterase [Christensenellaceae bacterium]